MDKTWNGNNGSSLTDGMNWTPPGVPQPGDTAVMSTGFGILGDSDLNGVTLSFGVSFPTTPNTPPPPPPTLVLWNSTMNLETRGFGGGTIIAEDNSTLNILNASTSDGTTLTVDIADWDQLNGTYVGGFKNSVVINGSSSVYRHTGDTGLALGGNVTLNTNVLGSGEWHLEFLGSLRTNGLFDETVDFGRGGLLDVQKPTLFTGQINLSGEELENPSNLPQVSLDGLFATAATYDGGILSLLFGCQVIDQVKVTDPASFSVYQGPAGVEIFSAQPSTPLPFDLLLKT